MANATKKTQQTTCPACDGKGFTASRWRPNAACGSCAGTGRVVNLARRSAEIEAIAKTAVPEMDSLETRNSDALDFHYIAVWSLKAVLEAAYEAGRAAAKN